METGCLARRPTISDMQHTAAYRILKTGGRLRNNDISEPAQYRTVRNRQQTFIRIPSSSDFFVSPQNSSTSALNYIACILLAFAYGGTRPPHIENADGHVEH